MLDEGVDPPLPFERQAPTGRKAAVIGSGPAGMAAAFYLLLSGHDVTVFERDPAPGGMLRYGIPQYRLPKVEVLEAEYESVTRLGGKIVCNAGLGVDFTLDDLTYQGFDAVVVAIGCYDTNKLGHPRRGRRRGARRARVPADGDARPALPRPRRQARRRHRWRLHLDGLLADVDPPGRGRGHPRLPPRHEGHARLERGPRGHRGRRHRHLPGRPGPGRHRQEGQGHRRRVHPDGARRAGRVRPAPPGAGARHGVHDPLRPRPAGHRPGPGPDLDRSGVGGRRGDQAEAAQGRLGHVRDRPGGRLRDRRRPDRRGDRRRGDRRGPALRLRRRRVPARDGPGRHPDPPDAGRTAARVPVDRAVHQRGQDAALPADRARGRGAEPLIHRIRAAVHPRGRGRRVDPLSPVHLRGDRLLRPAPPRHRVRHDAPDARARPQPRARASGASPRTGSPASTTTTSATIRTPSSCASRRAASTAGGAPRSARRSSAPPATTSCASASTRWSRRRST